MNRYTPMLTAALLACGALGASAQEKATPPAADKTQVVPKKEQLTPNKPSVSVLDDNTQRAHDRDRGAAPKDAAAANRGDAARSAQAMPAGGVRDWAAIDTNHDNLIGPEEMEAALKEAGPQAKKK